MDEDIALADSFINFDYALQISPSHNAPDPPIGSGSSMSDPPAIDSTIQERIDDITSVENEGSVNEGIGNDEISAEVVANDDANEIQIEVESESSESESESSESESESSESESSSSSSSENIEEYELEEGEIVDSDAAVDDESEDDIASWSVGVHDEDRSRGKPVRSKNELENLPMVPPVNVNLGPHHQMLPVGVVTSIVAAQVIVEGMEKHEPLNEGSILWITEKLTPLGLIDEIFGPVVSPYYVVRYNSANEVPEGIREGTLISFVAEFANHVLNIEDLYKKGYDASGLYDEEVSDEAEFSDDEKEAEYRRTHKLNKRGQNNQNPQTMENDRMNVTPQDGSIPTMFVAPTAPLVAPTAPLVAHGHFSPIPGTGQGFFAASNANPQFYPANAGPSSSTTGVWTNGPTLPPHQFAMPPNWVPTNGVSWYPENTQISHQMPPVPGIPFQQQLNPIQMFPTPTNPIQMFPTPTMYPPGVQADTYAHGPMNQNQFTFGLRPAYPQFPPPTNFHSSYVSGNQHGPPHQFDPPINFHSSSISGYQNPPQFQPSFNLGAYDGGGRMFSGGRGRRPFHRGGRGWRPVR
ncbi:uncharacterized protein [Cicer arietinum]|uniref:H/ACA ribonucleoprotein complex non-core subunit NAF1 n=1 Tax=Cicer arietinum TaxID=3827 RepID=A0A1S2XFR6_CICAR|nr:H/ACA ribonucleoprotein complex non-core subunit NAF1-like [Cicer arietinum]